MGKHDVNQNTITQWTENTPISNLNNPWEWEKKSGILVEKWIELPKRQLSHVLLAEQQKNKIKKVEKHIVKLSDKIELNSHRIESENVLLNNYQSAFVNNDLNIYDLNFSLSMALKSLWFDDMESFLAVYEDPKAWEDYFKENFPDEESQQDAYNKIEDIFEQQLALKLSKEKSEHIATCIDQKKKDIEGFYRKWSQLQAQIDKFTKNIRDLIYWWWLDQCLHIWNEDSLKDSVLWEDIDIQLKNIIDMYKNKEYVESHGLSLPKTLLLCGWPSSWKGFAAKVLANEMWRKMYTLKAEKVWWFGDTMETLLALFSSIEEKKESCIIFFDELDKIVKNAGDPNYSELLWNVILNKISRFKNSDLDVLIIGSVSNSNDNSVDDRFFKYENFEKQLFLSPIDKDKKIRMIEILIEKYKVYGIDFSSLNVASLVDKLTFPQDCIKEFVKNAVENAVLKNLWKWWIVQVLDSDFEKALTFIQSSQSQKKKYFK